MPYDLNPVNSPKLKGLALRAFTALMENGLFSRILLPSVLKKTGIARFRKRVAKEAPTNFPIADSHQGAGETDVPYEGLKIVDSVTATPALAPEDTGFRFSSITDYANAYQNQVISPEEVADRVVASIERSNRGDLPLQAIIKCQADDVQRQAAESTKRIAEGRPRSILEGVPVAIKDELDMPPYTTGVGTRFMGKKPASEDATPVGRLRAAGALLIGKSNMFEIGISPTGNNPISGFARNPYNLNHDAGGSSSGSAAAVGSGLVPLAIGADGGGSIRIPASNCGVFGLKPTFGRVSEFGASPLCWSVAHVGPIAATSLDTAIGYAVCAGRDPRDPMSLHQPQVHLNDFHDKDLSGMTLGIYRQWFENADPEIVEQCTKTLQQLEQAGATIKEISIAQLEDTRVAHAITILTEMAGAMDPHYADHRKDFCHATRVSLALAKKFTSIDYLNAQRTRTESMQEWHRVFSEVDAVVTPTTACTAPYLDPSTTGIGESDMSLQTELMRYAVCANFCGLPAITFPAGYNQNGLPIGMQVISRHWQEHLLLRIAQVAEQKLERKEPSTHYNILSTSK